MLAHMWQSYTCAGTLHGNSAVHHGSATGQREMAAGLWERVLYFTDTKQGHVAWGVSPVQAMGLSHLFCIHVVVHDAHMEVPVTHMSHDGAKERRGIQFLLPVQRNCVMGCK